MRERKGSFVIEAWEEKPDEQWQKGKLSHTLAKKKFSGQIEGTGLLQAIMLRIEDARAMAYVGVEHISCTVDGRSGSFVLVHNAEALADQRKAEWKILPGSGTGQLTGISGHGSITPSHEFTLNYELPDNP